MAVATKIIQPTPSAYNYQLLIKHLLTTPLIYSPDQEIVYRDIKRYTYAEFGKRVSRLANALTRIGVKPGDTVAVMDWDSHRYLECFFGVPMLGAVLHTINIRLTPEQLIYTINHAEDDIILVNKEFLPMLEAVKDRFETVKKIVLLSDDGPTVETSLNIDGEYETLLTESDESYDFPDFDENSIATTFYTTGTTGLPKGVYFSHRQLVLHTYGILSTYCAYKSQANLNSTDVYMPITPMFHVHAWGVPYMVTLMGNKQVYPGRYEPDLLLELHAKEKVTFSPLRTDHLAHAPHLTSGKGCGFEGLEGDHRRFGPAKRIGQGGHGTWHQCLCRIRHVRNLPRAHRGQSKAQDAELGHGEANQYPGPHRSAGSRHICRDLRSQR